MHIITELLSHLIPYGHYAYIIMFAILLACGFGLPMPEDIVLVSGGILAAQGVTSFEMTLLVCMAGVIIGDGIVFTIGRKVGPRIKETRGYARIMSPAREKQVMRWFHRHGDRVIFFARFAPGLRMPLFLTAGIYQVAPWKFVALDGVAALISVPLWIWLGYFFGANLEALESKMRQAQIGIYGLLGLLLGGLLTFWLVKKRLKTKSLEST